MNSSSYEPLPGYEISGFVDGFTVIARIFHERTGWYAGPCTSVRFENSVCLVRISPLIRFKYGYSQPVDPEDPEDLLLTDEHIIDGIDKSALPFRFRNPQKVLSPLSSSLSLLAIRADDGKTAILSRRPEDIKRIEKILGFKI